MTEEKALLTGNNASVATGNQATSAFTTEQPAIVSSSTSTARETRFYATTVAFLCLTTLFSAPSCRAQGNATVRFDFETGDLQGWKIVEGAFPKLLTDRPNFHHGNIPYNKQGKYFISTLETPAGTPDDSPTGVAESPVFTLAGPDMSLLVGGGDHPETYVALCTLDGEEALRAQGKNDQIMQRVTWHAPELVGKQVFLRMVDAHTGGWGHVTFDDFTAQGTLDPAATEKHFATRTSWLEAMKSARMPKTGTPEMLRAAIQYLAEAFGARYPKSAEYLTRLAALEPGLASADPAVRKPAQRDFVALQREALIANPLVSGQPILYVSRNQYRPDHHNTETMFQTDEINTGSFQGPGALKAVDFANGAAVKTLVATDTGVVRDPDVYFTGGKVLFSLRKSGTDTYHIYEVNADGTGLKQLTAAPGVTDIDPLYLPDDSVMFSGTREPKYCMCNRHIMANLFRMGPDGANIVQLSKNTLMDEHGALMPDGRVLYDRWEYVDRNFGDAQGLWTVNPDGTNHCVYWGNNTGSPGAVLDARVIPGSDGQVVCNFSSCHDRPWGAIAVVDRSLAMDGPAAVVRTWPADATKLVSLDGSFDNYIQVYPKYEDPYPLSDPNTNAGAGRFFLCSRMIGRGEEMGICLLDTFGNEIMIHEEAPGCFNPMPLSARPRPPVIPTRRDFASKEGSFYVVDVYQGTHMQGVKRGTVKYLRVVESGEKRSWTFPNWNGQGSESAAMNWNDFSNKQVLGTVPVEEDGSAYVSVPCDKFVYFQLLDDKGMMVQSMRSGTMVQSGERSGCVGCHETRHGALALPGGTNAALRLPPRKLEGWHGPAHFINYATDVQPVFDRNCLRCHDYGKPAGAKLNLAGDRDLVFNTSYNELWRKGGIHVVGGGPAQTQQAYSWGSHASKIVQTLLAGHHDVKLDADAFDRLVTWIDLNAPYYPTYDTAYPDGLGGRAPLSDAQIRRLQQITGVPFFDLQSCGTNQGPQLCFERPELSPCLARLSDHGAAEYKEAMAIIASGAGLLAKTPRGDGTTFTPCPLDQRREAKYAQRREIELANRAAILAGRKVYDPGVGE